MINWKFITMVFSAALCQGLHLSLSPVLEMIQKEFPEISLVQIQMLITVPTLLAMVSALAAGSGKLSQNKKKMLLAGCLISGAGGLFPFWISSFIILFFSRIILGAGLGLVMVYLPAVISEHYRGKERAFLMGVQGAGAGTGMMLATLLGGFFGNSHYQNALLVHTIGIGAAWLVWRLLPETGKSITSSSSGMCKNRRVFLICLFGWLEMVFVITFSTNLAMHLDGEWKNNAFAAGTLIAIFSGIQIFMGLFLRFAEKILGRYTLPAAMACFGAGALLLIAFPSQYKVLILGAILCGVSQGIFIPQAVYEITSVVPTNLAASASACFTAAICMGQLVSPYFVNQMTRLILKSTSTGAVFVTGAIMMTAGAAILAVIKKKQLL